jgi:LmbE family N-acetylglucosaminyl deacetylase
MNRLLSLALTAPALVAILAAAEARGAQRPAARILAVFAHPDDEISVGPVLSKHAAAGDEVHLVTITSGQVGDSNTDIPRGRALGEAREAELRCSAQKLGILPPQPLGFMDGDISGWRTLEAIRSRIRELAHQIRPHVIVTWGPDGLSGHPDHRVASSLATEIFQESWPAGIQAPQKLYYFAVPVSISPAAAVGPGDRASIGDELVTTIVDAAPFVAKTRDAMHCHQTQWNPPAAVDAMFESRQKANGGKVWLRLALSRVGYGAGTESDILERVKLD